MRHVVHFMLGLGMAGALIAQATPAAQAPPAKPFPIPDSLAPHSLRLQRAINRKLRADAARQAWLEQAAKVVPQLKEAEDAMAALEKAAEEMRAAAKIPANCQLNLSGDWMCPLAAAQAQEKGKEPLPPPPPPAPPAKPASPSGDSTP